MFAHITFINDVIFKIKCHIKLSHDDLERIKTLPQYKDTIIKHFNENCSKSYGCVQSNK